MNTIEITPGKFFTGSKEFMAGALMAANVLNREVYDEHSDTIQEYFLAIDDFGLRSTLNDITNENELLEFIAEIRETDIEDLKVEKRYVSGVMYHLEEVGGYEKDVSFYEMHCFDTLDFVAGLREGGARYPKLQAPQIAQHARELGVAVGA